MTKIVISSNKKLLTDRTCLEVLIYSIWKRTSGRGFWQNCTTEGLRERTEYIDVFFFPHITQLCSVSDFLFTGGRVVSDFSVLKYY